MDSLVDTSILPDPFNPQDGDVYTRPRLAGEAARKIPQRVVVLYTFEEGEEENDDVSVVIDGSEKERRYSPHAFRAFLASVVGMEPFGRMKPKNTAKDTND
jgi:hypothetical protein